MKLFTFKRENFVWNQDSTNNFLQIQNTINKHKIFDVDLIQKNQASQSDLNYFNKNGRWYWSDKVKELYKESVLKNSYVRNDPDSAVNYAQTIYNENAILQILSQQSMEGHLLLNGIKVKSNQKNKYETLPNGFGDFPYTSGLFNNKSDDIIMCNLKDYDDEPYLERIHYTGKGGIFREQTEENTKVDYNQLENIIPTFKFLSAPCNPCNAFKEKPDYSCSFQINNNISNIWKYLWSIQNIGGL